MNPDPNPMSRNNLDEGWPPITAGYVPPGGWGSSPRPQRPTQTGDFPQPMAQEVIERLPRWAKVAFVARCARRVLPLCLPTRSDLETITFRSLAQAVDAAEQSAGQAQHVWSAKIVSEAKRLYPHDAEHAAGAALQQRFRQFLAVIQEDPSAWSSEKEKQHGMPGPIPPAKVILGAAGLALLSDNSYQAYRHYEPRYILVQCDCNPTLTAQETFAILLDSAPQGTIWNLAAPSADLAQLVERSKAEHWTDTTPVPPEVFGPLWRGMPPEWWTDDVLAGLSPETSSPTASEPGETPAPTV